MTKYPSLYPSLNNPLLVSAFLAFMVWFALAALVRFGVKGYLSAMTLGVLVCAIMSWISGGLVAAWFS